MVTLLSNKTNGCLMQVIDSLEVEENSEHSVQNLKSHRYAIYDIQIMQTGLAIRYDLHRSSNIFLNSLSSRITALFFLLSLLYYSQQLTCEHKISCTQSAQSSSSVSIPSSGQVQMPRKEYKIRKVYSLSSFVHSPVLCMTSHKS